MKKYTQRDKIRLFPTKWLDRLHRLGIDLRSDKKWEKLKKLDFDTCEAEKIDEVVGNDSWTTIKCDCCRSTVKELVILDEVYGQLEVSVCSGCLNRMIDTLKPECYKPKLVEHNIQSLPKSDIRFVKNSDTYNHPDRRQR